MQYNALTLTMDTAGPACQAVVSKAGRVLADESAAMARGHGEALVPMVERVLARAQAEFEDLECLAVTTGPGSFTGLRVAMAATRGFSAALNIPSVGMSSLHALAMTDQLDTATKAPRAVALDARNGLVYGQRFDRQMNPIDAPHAAADIVFAASIEDETRIVGPMQTVLAGLAQSSGKPVTLGVSLAFPSTAALAALAAQLEVGERPQPVYLKDAAAKPKPSAGLRTLAG